MNENASRASGIIFDCDGTLVDSLGSALESFNYALERMGAPGHTPEQIKKFFGASGDRILTSLLGGDRVRGLQAFEHYKEHQTELAKTVRMHEGILELLDTCLSEGVPIGIVTGRHAEDLEIILRPHGISSRFLCLVTDNQVARSKPAPDGILLAASKMALPATSCFYVGDSSMDIRAANDAGALGVAALWDGLAKRMEMEAEHPFLLAAHPRDVWRGYLSRFG